MKRVNEPDLTSFELLRQGYGSSQVGNSRAVDLAGVGSTPFLGNEICRVQVGDDVACSWVVTLAPLSPVQQQGPLTGDQGTPQIINDAFAIVEWGVGKGRSYAVVDWTLGQQFSVYGSYVSVRGVVNSLGAAAVGPAARTQMSAFIAPGRVDRFPTRTILYGSIGPGSNEIRAVPPFAKRCFLSYQDVTLSGVVTVSVLVQGSLTGVPGTVLWNVAPGAAFADFPFAFPADFKPVGVPTSVPMECPMGTNFVHVVNGSAVSLTLTRVRYELQI